jgi:copper chaperone
VAILCCLAEVGAPMRQSSLFSKHSLRKVLIVSANGRLPESATEEVSMESINIKGMSCQHCVRSVRNALEAVAGVSHIEVSLEKNQVRYLGSGVDREQVRAAIRQIGFEPGE